MLRRVAARLATGPLAFLLAGAIDVSLLWGRWAVRAVETRVRRLPR